MKPVLLSLCLVLAVSARSPAASTSPAIAGELEVARTAYEGGDYQKARDIWEALATQGNAEAQYRIGYMYAEEKGVQKNDVEMVRWMKLATENGHCRAPFWVGFEYSWGLTYGPFRWDEAAKWFRIGAERGDPKAQEYLARQYESGEGVIQDYVDAAHWYKLAAEQGYDGAQARLAEMYKDGRGLQQDVVQAHKWYNISAAAPMHISWITTRKTAEEIGDRIRKERDDLAAQMTASQVAEAHKLAREWKPAPSSCAEHYPE